MSRRIALRSFLTVYISSSVKPLKSAHSLLRQRNVVLFRLVPRLRCGADQDSGETLFRAAPGFKEKIHRSSLAEAGRNLPVVILFVDIEEPNQPALG